MNVNKMHMILKTGFIISLVVLAGSIILFTQIAPGSIGRTAMILTGISAAASGIPFFLQLKQNRFKPEPPQ